MFALSILFCYDLHWNDLHVQKRSTSLSSKEANTLLHSQYRG